MMFKRTIAVTVALAGSLLALVNPATGAEGEGSQGLTAEAEAFSRATRGTVWEEVRKIPLSFASHHPQGMSLVGDKIFLSSVEILEPTVKYPAPVDGYDRTPGKGRGHVFVLTREGELLEDIVLGEGDVYHPGGIDFDGEHVWVPVAEYRPDSRSIVYTIDPETFEVVEQFREADHVGGVVADRSTQRVSGVSWGSRKLFTWNSKGRLLGTEYNSSHFVDYQDCEYAGAGLQLCSGIATLKTAAGTPFELGGLALTELSSGEIVHEIPFQSFSAAGHSITRNPVVLEAEGAVLRMFAAPDDGEEVAGTELYIFEATP